MTCSCLSEAKGMTKNMNKISEVTRQDIIECIGKFKFFGYTRYYRYYQRGVYSNTR